MKKMKMMKKNKSVLDYILLIPKWIFKIIYTIIKYIFKILFGIFDLIFGLTLISNNDNKKENEKDNHLEDWQKDLVKKGEYDPTSFDEQELEEDDYYYEDK